jgi:hypothetical protein
MIVEDINTHHLTWGGPGTKIDSKTETILEIVDEYNLVMIIKEGMVTWKYKD